MTQKSEEIEHSIPSRLEELSKIEKISGEIARKMDFSKDQKDNLSIAVTEAVGNAIVHGNKKHADRKVCILFKLKKNQVDVFVKDEGKGFNPDELDDPLNPQNLMKESGRGIFILKALTDGVSFSFSPSGTTVKFTLKKK
ncbi:ATP-binding protein [bacterium]|nr:ATP-binding protein [bacterium]